MRLSIETFANEINEFLQSVLPFTVACRSTTLQNDAIQSLKKRLHLVSDQRTLAASDGDEQTANFLLSVCCALDSVLMCIDCILKIKIDKPHDAWNSLVSAQQALKACLRAHPCGESMSEFGVHLHSLETVLFPPQVYTSVGVSYTESFCSICDVRYGECGHIAGRPYLGQFCSQIVKKSVLHEVSIVEVPENKRCIVTSYSNGSGQMVDRLSLLPVEERNG
jgi:hypothetical protein